MVVTATHLSHDRAEMNILEINWRLQAQLAESQQQFEDLKEKFLIIQATAYSLAKKLKKYKCEEEKDIDSVLRDEVQFIEEKLAEKLGQAEELRQYKALVRCQAKELTQLREKLREEKEASRSLNQHLKALLTPDDPDKSQGQDLQEQLAEGHRLAECLVNKLSVESDEDDDGYVTDEEVEEVEKVQESPDPSYSPSDSNQPHRSTKVTFEGDEVDSAMIIDSECSQNEDEEMPYFLPAPTQETRPQGTCSGDMSYYLSEMETSLTQPEPSTLVPNCLGLQLDQRFDCGNGFARQGPSPTTCSFTANADSGTQCSFQEMVAQPYGGMKSTPQREDDPCKIPADNTREQQLIGNIHFSSVFKPKMIKRKSRFSKWNPYPSHLGRRGTKYYQKDAKDETMPIRQLFQLMRKN
ncbi:neuroblastoma breakpoint family member 4-like isoform X1 [Aotus nancymaae]|uniref:neuroblastoma breakpoint family member 4-like isoform X1 n=1 Tax=Aotus nancymaae TaxID=37293 RepID=UPI0030FE8D73